MIWICKNCRTESDDTVDVCWKCGNNKTGKPSKYIQRNNIAGTEQRYPALITISNLHRTLAWVIAIIAVILSLYIFGEEGLEGFYTIGLILIGAAIITISFLAFSELIKLLIDIERNTRSKSS